MSGLIVDTNVNLGRWPFRRLPLDATEALATKLRDHSVAQAWAGSFDGLLHKDIAGVNARLVEECQKSGILLPFGSINPMLPDWEDDLRRCHESHRMRGVRLHPGYHGYRLDHPAFERLLALAAERGLIVQLAVAMEDERTLHPLVQPAPVDVTPLPALVRALPGVRLVLLNAFRSLRPDEARRLAQASGIHFEIATLEGVGGIGNLLQRVPLERVLFGSHAPQFYFESALLKMKESPLDEKQAAAILNENARRLLGPV